MNEYDLELLHSLLNKLAEEVKRICNDNNIRYSLTGGSMLGAIRHKGFIPWDDDMDIAMLREDYDRFIEACKTQIGPEYEIQTIENDENYFYGFAKVLLKDTYLVQYCHENTKQKKGIYIDIFPLDNVPEARKEKQHQKRVNYLLMKMLDRKYGVAIEDKNSVLKFLGFHLLDILNIPFSGKFLKRKLVENMKKFDDEKTDTVCNLGGYYGYDKETTYRKYFEDNIVVPFENTEFSIIKDYDTFLRTVYGDYMKLPPKEKRHTHGFRSLDFGPYRK